MRVPTWVCPLCSQHFIRKYSAKKHNQELHEGNGTIVKFMDYIIGRIDGKFLPNDPSMYYRVKRKWPGSLQTGTSNTDRTVADSTYGQAFQQMPSYFREITVRLNPMPLKTQK